MSVSPPPLLVTESADDFNSLKTALSDEIKPRNVIEETYVNDIAVIVWEISRYRRCKAAMLNMTLRAGLVELLAYRLTIFDRDRASELADRWFTDSESRKLVLDKLAEYHLDESALEAEVVRSCAEALQPLEAMLASLELRRDRALYCIRRYREDLPQPDANRVIEGKVIPRLKGASSKQPSIV